MMTAPISAIPAPVEAVDVRTAAPAVVAHPAAPTRNAAAEQAAANLRIAVRRRAEIAARVAAPVLGLLVFLTVWYAIAQMGTIPGPARTRRCSAWRCSSASGPSCPRPARSCLAR